MAAMNDACMYLVVGIADDRRVTSALVDAASMLQTLCEQRGLAFGLLVAAAAAERGWVCPILLLGRQYGGPPIARGGGGLARRARPECAQCAHSERVHCVLRALATTLARLARMARMARGDGLVHGLVHGSGRAAVAVS